MIVSISMDDGFVTQSQTPEDMARGIAVKGYWPVILIDTLSSV